MRLLTIFFIFYVLPGLSEEVGKKKISSLLQLGPENYLNKIEDIQKSIGRFLSEKKSLCQKVGVSEAGEGNGNEAKEDKKVCLDELKRMHQEYINNLFLARKRYLEHLHKKRVQQLSEVKQKALDGLKVY